MPKNIIKEAIAMIEKDSTSGIYSSEYKQQMEDIAIERLTKFATDIGFEVVPINHTISISDVMSKDQYKALCAANRKRFKEKHGPIVYFFMLIIAFIMKSIYKLLKKDGYRSKRFGGMIFMLNEGNVKKITYQTDIPKWASIACLAHELGHAIDYMSLGVNNTSEITAWKNGIYLVSNMMRNADTETWIIDFCVKAMQLGTIHAFKVEKSEKEFFNKLMMSTDRDTLCIDNINTLENAVEQRIGFKWMNIINQYIFERYSLTV